MLHMSQRFEISLLIFDWWLFSLEWPLTNWLRCKKVICLFLPNNFSSQPQKTPHEWTTHFLHMRYTISWARCTHLIILVVGNEGFLFNKCSKILYFCQKIISFPTYLSSKSSINHLLDVILFRRRAFGSYCPLRHWLPLTVWLPLTRRMNLDSSKRKVEKKSLRKCSRCDGWRVADLKFHLATSCENLHNVNFNQQRRRYPCLCRLSSIPLFASLIDGYLPMLKRA